MGIHSVPLPPSRDDWLEFSKIWKRRLKVTTTTFLFREVEQWEIYQLVPNVSRWKYFGWLSSRSEPVSMWGSLQDIHAKSRTLFTSARFRVITLVDQITNWGNAVCCILLLPGYNVKLWVKRQLFWQAGDGLRMQVTPVWCGWVGMTAPSCEVGQIWLIFSIYFGLSPHHMYVTTILNKALALTFKHT